MQKIATPNELQSELRRLLAYAQTERPSRDRIASALMKLSNRVAALDKEKCELQALSTRLAGIRVAAKTYIIYVDGKEMPKKITAGSMNAAEKKARKLYPDAQNVSVEYTEV